MIAFHSLNLSVENYQGRKIPYNLGVVVVYSYAVLFAFPPALIPSLSLMAFIYILTIWVLGFIDDAYGSPFPKGLKGHLFHSIKHRSVTTGLLKAVGTMVIALVFVWSEQTEFLTGLAAFLLLTGLPHMMNLFDTRPLRVWKVAFVLSAFLMVILPLPPFTFVIILLTIFYLLFILEGHKKAMLGDNGATAIGAIFAVVFIHHTSLFIQIGIISIVAFFILLAEKKSFSVLIERVRLLRFIDQIGISKR